MGSKIDQSTFNEHLVPLDFFNTESETIPIYAAMIVTGIARDPRTGEMLASVRKCTAEDERQQNHRMVLFNIGGPVGAKDHGIGTFSLPAAVRIGGPTLTDPGGGADAVPTTDDDEPLRLDCVGPVRSSWDLWRGGVTHTIEFVEIKLLQRYASVSLNTSPGAWVRFDEAIGPGEIGTVKLQVRPADSTSTDDYENSQASGSDIELSAEHGGLKQIAGSGQLGQAKLTSGRWAIDVNYC